MKRAKSGHFCVQHDTPTPRSRSVHLGVELHLGELEPRVYALSGSPRRTYESCFGSSLLSILTIIHWINEDPNK